MGIKTMTNGAARLLAERIARDLFTNGQGEHADRLVLVVAGVSYDLGGWCESAVVDRIVMALTHPLQPLTRRAEPRSAPSLSREIED